MEDDLQLYLQCDRADGLSLFDLTSSASPAPTADADATVRSQWATRDAAARLAVRRHLPTAERAHFSQYESAQTLYDAVVARYSSPATAALSRLMLPYLFLPLLPFPQSLTSLRTSALVTLATALRFLLIRDHFLSVCPTTLTVDLLEKALLAAEKSIVALGASRGDPRIPIFEGARGAGAPEELAGVVEVAVEAAEGVGVAVGVVAGVEVSVAVVEALAAEAVAVGAEAAVVVEVEEAVVEVVELVGVALRSGAAPVVVSASSSSSSSVLGTSPPLSSSVSGTLHVSVVGVLVCAPTSYAPATARVVAIFDLDFDAILAAMYAVTISDEGDCYRCFPPDPGNKTTALGAGEAAALGAGVVLALGASASASSGAGESALSDRTTLTPLGRPVAVSLADPSGGPVLSHFSTVLPCPAAPSGTLSGLYLPSFSTNLVSGADLQDAGVHQFTPASQRVTHCSDARTGRHLATFTRRPGSSLYTLTTESPPVPASGQVAASGQVFAAASRSGPESAPCSCRLLSHETLLWHHRLGHPSLPRLRGMASRVLVSGLPRSLPPLPPGPGPSCIPCVEGRLRAAPHSSQFPPTEAPLQTLHMDVWGSARCPKDD
ncbi:unnamed protein product [Closterium sp. NIES-64]|nr:unnamed protein product [Closterium sp. NIES-64]